MMVLENVLYGGWNVTPFPIAPLTEMSIEVILEMDQVRKSCVPFCTATPQPGNLDSISHTSRELEPVRNASKSVHSSLLKEA